MTAALPVEEPDLFDYYYNPPGSAPGTLGIESDAYPTEITLFDYGPEHFSRCERPLFEDCLAQVTCENSVTWVDAQGLGDQALLAELGRAFGLPALILEDMVNVPQRPKLEYHPHFVLITTQIVMARPKKGFWTEQISFVLGKNYLLTLQEEPTRDPFEPIRQRLAQNVGAIRSQGADYLCYALIDAIIDNYFPVLETYGDRLEDLEDEAIERPAEATLQGIYRLRRELLALRRNIWPQREVFNALIRDKSDFITPEVLNYLRDCYDHTIQIIDVIETYRELGSSLTDVYLSVMSHKLNEVMKVLTIISTVFIPLTFIAGIYGMNFNPEASPYNMPELNWYWGYFICLGVMIVLTLFQLYVFWRRGWFHRNKILARRPTDP
ncbi:MAG: magnesium/cobalt transporter CorA [Cyanobacteriota bacterium]|nr:magnesium/cobalt transporter CorA [Cyanobacteriota bacterium]